MINRNIDELTINLLSIPPLVSRALKRNMIPTRPSDVPGLALSYHHYEILGLLTNKGPMPVTKIGNNLQIAKAHMTKLINRLVALHLVERISNAKDRRSYNIALTPEAKTFEKRRLKYLKRAMEKFVSGLTNEEMDNLSNALSILHNILNNTENKSSLDSKDTIKKD